ncbi:hypothetical protein [Kitasatospora sp. MAP5-34]|uniref:hypothetical protein n=1 Tax=Kitasatospora sp. MAP5-34 TaxID=3035102 RepID=UPI00247361D8|nr:hypothetical protein [Kitasatospora sp. MAP5-34]MDH6576500.1 hypothetical protein [Kitasatospora sp. MAP5-34]
MNARSLVPALAARAWAQQGRQVLAVPAAVSTGIIVLLLVLPQLIPGGRHGDQTLPPGAAVRIVDGTADGTASAMAVALLTAPALLGIGAALLSLTVSRSILGPDVSSGVMENLLATSMRPRSVFLCYVCAAFGLSALAWAVLAGTFLGLTTAVLAFSGSGVEVTGGYLTTSLLLPLASMLWATSLISFVAFVRPAWLKITAGLNGGPVRLAGILPALGSVIFTTVRPQDCGTFSWPYVIGVSCASAALMAALAALFNSERLLES